MFNSLYIYGIIRTNKDWEEHGIKESNVFLINEGNFSAIVHRCEEKPYISNDPAEIKDLILAHNEVLDKAGNDFGGVIPLSFNTIIKTSKAKSETSKSKDFDSHQKSIISEVSGTLKTKPKFEKEKTAEENLRSWLKDNEEYLQKIYDKINGKKEYGIRIYYEKEKLLKKIEELHKIKQLQQKIQIKSTGMAYLLKGKIKDEIDRIGQEQIFEYKQNFYNNIKGLVSDIVINQSKILLDEEKDLLVSISILVDKEQIQKVNNYLVNKNFYFNVAGPFAPYSFVNPQESQKHSVFDDRQNSEKILKSEISETPKTGGFCRNG